MLIGIGYALRVPILEWLFGKFNSYFLIIDVLQCIGLSLIFIVIIYKLIFKKTLMFSLIMLFLGLAIFITEPLYRFLEVPQLPLVLENYVSKINGSIFTIIPWFGYIAFGAFISTLFYRYLDRPRFKFGTVTGFFIVGILLISFSGYVLMKLYYWTNISLFKDVAFYNYLFIRLGNVLILFGLFYLFENYLKKPLILKIGQKTLSIYVIHFIIIYGSFTGLGLNRIIGKTLLPWSAVIGAVLFLISVCFLSFYYARTNAFVYNKLGYLFNKIKSRLEK